MNYCLQKKVQNEITKEVENNRFIDWTDININELLLTKKGIELLCYKIPKEVERK